VKPTPSLYPEQKLKRRTMSWALKLKVNPAEVVIGDMPSKWGSCSPDGVVMFAEDLADTDPEFQDYVIVHELLHLRYSNHGRRFKAMMTAMVPRWRELERNSRRAIESTRDRRHC
jgi:predicted metal-dependent hydrolase